MVLNVTNFFANIIFSLDIILKEANSKCKRVETISFIDIMYNSDHM